MGNCCEGSPPVSKLGSTTDLLADTEGTDVKHIYHLKRGVTVLVVLGSITEDSSDCIVHATNSKIDFHGQVGQALLNAGGSDIKFGGSIGHICEAGPSGNLPCKQIIHVDVHQFKSVKWKGLILACLDETEKLGYSSVALPLLGTGVFKQPVSKVAQYLKEALKEYIGRNSSQGLHSITIITPSNDNVTTIHNQLKKLNEGKYGSLGTTLKLGVPKKAKLDSNSIEYKVIAAKLTSQVGEASVKQIDHIQTPNIYHAYQLQKKLLTQYWKQTSKSGTSISQRLWHGCPMEATDNIIQTGFNRTYCQNGTLYGKGVYFAKDARTSAEKGYSVPDWYGHKYMFLCDVITGAYTKGKWDMKEPPRINSNDPNAGYHSVVDNESNPNIFVVFKDDRAYPEYLVTFTM